MQYLHLHFLEINDLSISRILQGFFSLFGVASLVFLVFILPGDPAEMMLDQNQNSDQIEF